MKIRYIGAAVVTALSVTLAGMPASADDSNEVYRIQEIYGDNVVYLGESPEKDDENVSGEESKSRLFTVEKKANAGGDSAFLDRCEGERYGLRDMDQRSGGTARAEMYEELDKFCREFWNDTSDLELETSLTGQYMLYKIDNTGKGLSVEDAIEAYYTYMYDNPIYYFLSVKLGFYNNGSLCLFISPKFLSGSYRSSCEQKIKSYLTSTEPLVVRRRSAYTNISKLHDKLCSTMVYRYSDGYDEYSIIGGIVNGEGVCESYAKTFSLMLNYHGIDNAFAAGEGFTGNKWEDHAWDVVRFDDGKYYWVDVTWDDDIAGKQYLAVGNTRFTKDHTVDSPLNTGTKFLYELPEVSDEDFDYTKTYFDPLWYDYDGSRTLNNRDLKALQNKLTSAYDTGYDVNDDGKLTEEDIRALQIMIAENG